MKLMVKSAKGLLQVLDEHKKPSSKTENVPTPILNVNINESKLKKGFTVSQNTYMKQSPSQV